MPWLVSDERPAQVEVVRVGGRTRDGAHAAANSGARTRADAGHRAHDCAGTCTDGTAREGA